MSIMCLKLTVESIELVKTNEIYILRAMFHIDSMLCRLCIRYRVAHVNIFTGGVRISQLYSRPTLVLFAIFSAK